MNQEEVAQMLQQQQAHYEQQLQLQRQEMQAHMQRELEQHLRQQQDQNIQDVNTLMQQMVQMMDQQTQLLQSSQNRVPEAKVEGISMPHYYGKITESVDLFFEQAIRFFEAKNIRWSEPDQQKRVLAMVASNLRQGAAAWFSTIKDSINNIQELATAMRNEFVPRDLQKRLRDELFRLKQRDCKDLADYITKHRQIMCNITDMSDLDRITYFVRGLTSKIQSEVQYQECKTLADAISVAMQFERAHAYEWKNKHQKDARNNYYKNQNAYSRNSGPTPMEIGNKMAISKDECFKKKLCFYCKKEGHRLSECRKRKSKNKNNVQSRAINSSATEVESKEEEDVVDIYSNYAINVQELVTNPEKKDQVNTSFSESKLMRKKGLVGDKNVVILLDSGASCNLVRPGLVSKTLGKRNIRLQRFDGTLTPNQSVILRSSSVTLDNNVFNDLEFIETPLPTTHDIILGLPWFSKYQPVINWRTHNVQVQGDTTTETQNMQNIISPKDFERKIQNKQYYEVYRVKFVSISTVDNPRVPEYVQSVLNEYKDVFPDVLPDGLPPNRRVEFELNMKEDAKPSSRPPFRLSKTEQDALEQFVIDNLKKIGLKYLILRGYLIF